MMNEDNHFNMNDVRKMFDKLELWLSKANDRLGRLEEKHKMKSRSVNSTKKRIPIFRGMNNDDSYLKWEKEVEKVFACHNYSEEKKVRLASFSFADHAVLWWDKMLSSQRRYEVDPIVTWDEMKRVMRKRYAPSYFKRGLDKKHESGGEISTQVEKVLDTDCQESLIVRDVVDVIESLSPTEFCEETNKEKEKEKKKCELENEREKEKNIESSLEETHESKKNDDKKEAEKEENQINGPMESKNQSEEVKCDKEESSLILTNTNDCLSSGVIPFLQEPTDFVFGERFDSWARNELWQPKKFNKEFGFKRGHSLKLLRSGLKGVFHLTPNECLFHYFNSRIGCDNIKMSFDGDIVNACGSCAFHKFYVHDSFLFHGNRIWMLAWFMHEMILEVSQNCCLVEHFRMHMLYMLSKCFCWTHAEVVNSRYVAFRYDEHKFKPPDLCTFMLNLQGEYFMLDICEFANHSTYYMISDSRTNLFEERGDDASMGGTSISSNIKESMSELVEETWTIQMTSGPSNNVENVTLFVGAERGVFQHIIGLNISRSRVGLMYYTSGDLFGPKSSYFGHTKLIKTGASIMDENHCIWSFIFDVH